MRDNLGKILQITKRFVCQMNNFWGLISPGCLFWGKIRFGRWVSHELHEVIFKTTAIIIFLLLIVVTKVLEGWVSTDTKGGAKALLLCAIYCSKLYFDIVFQFLCSSRNFRFCRFAMTTPVIKLTLVYTWLHTLVGMITLPWCIKHDKIVFLLLEGWFEIFLTKMFNLIFFLWPRFLRWWRWRWLFGVFHKLHNSIFFSSITSIKGLFTILVA